MEFQYPLPRPQASRPTLGEFLLGEELEFSHSVKSTYEDAPKLMFSKTDLIDPPIYPPTQCLLSTLQGSSPCIIRCWRYRMTFDQGLHPGLSSTTTNTRHLRSTRWWQWWPTLCLTPEQILRVPQTLPVMVSKTSFSWDTDFGELHCIWRLI